jgi:hypothetical protein
VKWMLIGTSGLLFAAAFFVHYFTTEEIYSASTSDVKCLALNIYWEARSDPVEGQLAVSTKATGARRVPASSPGGATSVATNRRNTGPGRPP